MGRIEKRLQELGLVLPAPMDPPGNFELVTVHAGVAYVAGHTAIDGSTVLVHGTVGGELSLDEGYRAARAWFARRSSAVALEALSVSC